MTDISKLAGLRVGAAVCGSFCTFSRAFRALEELTAAGCDVTPIMSECAYNTDTRFGRAQEHAARLFDITGKTVLHEITTTEPIGPKKMFDVLLVAPCTGNTLAKLAAGIIDTPVIAKIMPQMDNADIYNRRTMLFTKSSYLLYVIYQHHNANVFVKF